MFSLARSLRRLHARTNVQDNGYPHKHLLSYIQEIASLPGPTEPIVAQWTDGHNHFERRYINTPTMGLPRGCGTTRSLLLVPPSPTSRNVLRRALYLSLGAFGANPAGALTPIYPNSEANFGDLMPLEGEPTALTAEVRRRVDGDTVVDGTITVRRYEQAALVPAARV